MPVKPLSFKGDKKPSKKRKHNESSLTTSSTDPSLAAAKTTSRSTAAPDDDDDSWVSPSSPADIKGPTVLVLPTSPPTCLASDSNGRVFASPLENVVENDPRTAEPHDVRQVWVAQQVAGMGEGHLGFKGAHGGWLSCDSVGILGATREARGMEEAFIVDRATELDSSGDTGGGANDDENEARRRRHLTQAFVIQTAASKKGEGDNEKRYICATVESSDGQQRLKTEHGADEEDQQQQTRQPKKISIALRGDGEAGDIAVRLIIRMQARFLPQSTTSAAAQRSKDKVSRKELETAIGRRLEDHEVKRLKKAKREGGYHEEVLDLRAKGRHDKFA